jgi:hypothetical protein
VEVEELSQSEDSRRRLKFARHLPLSGPFRLVELDLAPLLPPSALAPFADEISARERRRRRRAEERRREAARDKKAAAAAARARQVPHPRWHSPTQTDAVLIHHSQLSTALDIKPNLFR